ncbi:hypothetical protein AGABI1DRAFT_39047 [Agaricus bisporus var. burnettii JB137-S8]|uniref:Hepatocellular carcinoma-associated antigen 59 domain-containing protein n=1 Tax=Agaricus bisporus var. burnettii (strain JB137-S8 / ATCC MYA-4627 / FGSC 10392) TaxID=597362 RepID=K5XA20_AGABU|nr:hypothetical protein AGABI2DRAFT_78642 [Agaricus bisporus var. bisporus H97]XP_007328873.1 uncharacterized protein AGABI1DRAFT_39047 [Agaricus bisporus var. burnettii JB137-S8]EKM79907.1 hypothetical protein AGABI1DRAFT_39047 [Agaricus bisporus var. burnettii JB137-S8]EKV42439.1 hypothetical protein AGABI2DRAFT_78642 [Agaricus bisporus var. bisporus H97]
METIVRIADLIELRRLRRARRGIDVARLNKGDVKRRRKREREEEGEEEGEQGGLRKGAPVEEDDEEANKEAKARRVVRTNNFTQQTNVMDVDKHMMAYIEENLKIRGRPRDDEAKDRKPLDPQEALYRIVDKFKVNKEGQTKGEEGSVTNSLTMLTAIPEVDLGMDNRLKNIEETEKAKRSVDEHRQQRKKAKTDEEHLIAQRFYRPGYKAKSDADILRDAKLEAMGLPPKEESPRRSNHERNQMATDEIVMERFKKHVRMG